MAGALPLAQPDPLQINGNMMAPIHPPGFPAKTVVGAIDLLKTRRIETGVDYAGAPRDGSARTTGGDCDIRMYRGGSWAIFPSWLRSSDRNFTRAYFGASSRCFRVLKTFEYDGTEVNERAVIRPSVTSVGTPPLALGSAGQPGSIPCLLNKSSKNEATTCLPALPLSSTTPNL